MVVGVFDCLPDDVVKEMDGVVCCWTHDVVIGLLEGRVNGLVGDKMVEDRDDVDGVGVVYFWLDDERGSGGEG